MKESEMHSVSITELEIAGGHVTAIAELSAICSTLPSERIAGIFHFFPPVKKVQAHTHFLEVSN